MPKPVEAIPIHIQEKGTDQWADSDVPLRILSWNIQYAAGMTYNPWYGHPMNTDTQPTKAAVYETLDEIANVIRDEDPDIIFLQEVDLDSKRTYNINQLDVLMAKLPQTYRYYATAYYWFNHFTPHPKIWGKVAMALVTISKYKMSQGKRYQLPLMDGQDPLTQRFYLKRAVLETTLRYKNGEKLALYNTHLSAFSAADDATMKNQIQFIDALLHDQREPWVLAGDFNLLPPGEFGFHKQTMVAALTSSAKDFFMAHNDSQGVEKSEQFKSALQFNYQTPSEIHPLFEKYGVIPAINDIKRNRTKWYTWQPNYFFETKPTLTIDYLFYSKDLVATEAVVQQKKSHDISDHFPVIASIQNN